MIVAIYKGLGAERLIEDNQYYTVKLYKDENKDSTNLRLAQMMSDLGHIVIIQINSFEDMTTFYNNVINDASFKTLIIYPSTTFFADENFSKTELMKLNELFERERKYKDNTSIVTVKELRPTLNKIIQKHKETHSNLYENLTSKYEFISGLSRDENKSANLFTDNICTILKDRDDLDFFYDYNDELKYYVELDIKNSQELERLFNFYFMEEKLYENLVLYNTETSDIEHLEFMTHDTEITLKSLISASNLQEALRKLHNLYEITM